jgi:hypothetical protein
MKNNNNNKNFEEKMRRRKKNYFYFKQNIPHSAQCTILRHIHFNLNFIGFIEID